VATYPRLTGRSARLAATAGLMTAMFAAAGMAGCGGHVVVPGLDTSADPQAIQGAPLYPGAGTSGADQALPGASMSCYYTENDADTPAAALEYGLEILDEGEALHARLTFTPEFVDNTYGTGAIGWTKHDFGALTKSDHAELYFAERKGGVVLHFKLDYLSAGSPAVSGYGALGLGGDGELIEGDPSKILDVSSSLDRNLNERGHASFTVDSPPTDASYTPSVQAPDWDYRVVYEVWVDHRAFGPAGFGSAGLRFVHASPSKLGQNTFTVTRQPCPADWATVAPP
jgi:hypothetical protein